MSDLLAEVAEVVEQLCDPHENIEIIYSYDKHRNRKLSHVHRTTQPGLYAQLAAAVAARNITEDQSGRPNPASRPPLCLEAVSRLVTIATGAVRWARSLNVETRGSTEANLRGLVGAAPTLDDETQAVLLDELRSWRTWAAVMTGWQSPHYAPHVVCPIVDCGRPDTVRINLGRHVAFCIACSSRWDDNNIGVLADHIRDSASSATSTVKVVSSKSGHGW